MIKSILKNNNIKATNQRTQILSFIINQKEFTIKDISKNCDGIDQSTIYRILSLFEKKKIIIKILDNQEICYKFNKKDHKHYIECIKCHLKEELEECPYNNIDLKGYTVKFDETIKGICKNCQQQKLGIFVGSFNPPTKAHFEIGSLLLEKNIVDNIIYIPCNNLSKNSLISINNRYQMLLEMTMNYSKMIVDDIKLNTHHKSFNYLDLDSLKEKYPSSVFYIIIGSDNLKDLNNWSCYEELLDNNYFIVINRFNNNDLDIIEEKYSKFKNKFIIVEYNNDISSTKVRKMIKDNISLNDVLENNVINYINKHKLYK